MLYQNKILKILIVVMTSCQLFATEMSPQLKLRIEQNWEQQEKTTRNLKISDKQAVTGVIERGLQLIKSLETLGLKDECVKAKGVLDQIASEVKNGSNNYQELYLKARWKIRDLALKNPKIDFNQLLFVKRNTPPMQHQCGHRVGEAQIPGANLCVLTGLGLDGEVKEILRDDLTEGGIGRPDLSFDGKRIVFPFARKRKKGTDFGANTYGGTGLCDMYDIWEVDIDGSNLKQVTNHPKAEDTEPAYLPNGRIAFTSSRTNRFVQCGDWALVNGIYSIDPSGKDVRKITEPQDGEFYPSILEDGRIMYTRWDYVMKPYNTQQQLWAVNPDGRRAELIYGDYYKFSTGPIALFEARQIPGTSKVIATGAAHHNNCAGPIMIVDLDQNRGGPSGMQKVTPEVHYPEIQREGGGSNQVCKHGWYSSPYPLSETHYLVSYTFDRLTRGKYGIYLMDIYGNKELIYETNDKFSCYSPIPIRSRKRPPVIPDLVHGVPHDQPATIIVNDVYQGLLSEGVKRGEVKHLRIVEVQPKLLHTVPRRMDVGVNSGYSMRVVLGTVPVEEDGSAHFKLPPHKLLLFQALDKDYKAVKWMRNYVNVKPGETVSCIGCHEPYGMVPPTLKKMPMAIKRPASEITPPPFDIAGFSFNRIVQPVLDNQCIRCHDGSKGKKKAFDLRAGKLVAAPKPYDYDEGPQHLVSSAFLNLLKHVTYVMIGSYGNHDPKVLVPSAAKSVGSPASNVIKVIEKGHHNVKLSNDEWRSLVTWIDLNAPYYGDFDNIDTIRDQEGSVEYKNQPIRKAELDKKFKDLKVISYLDSGLTKDSLNSDKEKIKELVGTKWRFSDGWGNSERYNRANYSYSFADKKVVYELSNLKKGKRYHIGISWWQMPDDKRQQTVTIKVPGTKLFTELLPATALPSYKRNGQLASTFTLLIPEKFTGHEKLLVEINKIKGPNAMINEFFLAEEFGNQQASLMKDSHFLVADLRHNQVKQLNKLGEVTRAITIRNATDVKALPDGTILACGTNEVKLIDQSNKVLTQIKGQELFSAGCLSDGKILVNDASKKAVLIKDSQGRAIKTISTEIPENRVARHYHALHISANPDGTFWVAHRHNNLVRKYDQDGKTLRTIQVGTSATSVKEFENGHVIIACGKRGTAGSNGKEQSRIIEVDKTNNIVWHLSANEIPEINLISACGFQKLKNGNLVITNWTGHNYDGDYLPLFEITPNKQIVWKFTDTKVIPEPVGIDLFENKSVMKSKKQLLKELFPTLNVASYLDCGTTKKSLDGGKESIKELNGKNWSFNTGGKIDGISPASQSLSFDNTKMIYRISGLDKSKKYNLNVIMWELNDEKRVQKITIKSPKSDLNAELLPSTKLTNYQKDKQRPQPITLPIPQKFSEKGTIVVEIEKSSGPNAIVNEIFLTTDSPKN